MSYRKAEALLTAVVIARAASLPIIKSCLGGFATFNLMALRFVGAFICLVPFVWRRPRDIRRDTMLHGAALGALFFAIIAVELQGLRLTNSTATTAFLQNMAIVFVPLAEAALRRGAPHRQNLLCALLALAGVGFLLMRGGRIALSAGAFVCLGSAMLYTAYIILTDRLSHQDDPLLLGFVIIGAAGALSVAATVLFESPRLPATPREWMGALALAIVCGSIGVSLQPVAQRYVPSEKMCVFCALNPLSTCVMGWMFLGEWQGVTGVVGAALVLSSIVLSRMKLSDCRRPRTEEA